MQGTEDNGVHGRGGEWHVGGTEGMEVQSGV